MMSLYIVDGLNVLFRMYFGVAPLATAAGVPTGAVYGVARWVARLIREHDPTHLCVAMEGRGRNFRKDLSPTYKAGRDPLPESLISQIKLVRRLYPALGLPVIEAPGLEGDDAIATLTAMGLAAGHEVVICSADKDMFQLWHPPTVRQLDPESNDWIDAARIMKKMKVPAELVGDALALAGDPTDGVSGVPGIGLGTASKLLMKYGNLDQVIARAAEVKGTRGDALRAAIADGSLDVCRHLVRLYADAALTGVGALDDLRRREPDAAARDAFFLECEFYSLLSSGIPDELPTVTYDALGRPQSVIP